MRDILPIKDLDRNMGVVADQDVNALDAYVGPLPGDRGGHESISAANVQNRCVMRKVWRYGGSKDLYAPLEDIFVVDVLNKVHRFFSFKTLRKKLEDMVCAPNMMKVTPGIVSLRLSG